MKIADIIDVINDFAPRSLQESWDNSGVQVGDISVECSGVMLCVDPTEAVVDEAINLGCNLIISHHPLLFRGLKHICGDSQIERVVIRAICADIVIYSSHTSLDSTRGGVSYKMAEMLGAAVEGVLSPSGNDSAVGLGVIAELPSAMTQTDFVEHVKSAFGSPVCRCTATCEEKMIRRIAMCGGSGGEFIPLAIAAKADAYISSDTRYHDFVDHQSDIFLVDIGHFESESCAKDIFYHVITEKFPNFAVYKSELEKNSINYL